MRLNLIPFFALITICFAALLAQNIPQDELFWGSRPYIPEIASSPAIRVNSDLVEVPTVVLDSHDHPVGNLNKSDFLLFDNGKPQTISTFSILTGPGISAAPVSGAAPDATPLVQPRYVALFFDDVNTNFANLNFAREAAVKFIRKGLDPGERAGIFTASGVLTLDFTDDIQKLLATLAKLRLFHRMPDQGLQPCPPMTKYQAWVIVHVGGRTREFDDALKAAGNCCGGYPEPCVRVEAESMLTIAESWSVDTLNTITRVIRHLGDMPGRRILVVTSSGFLTLSFRQRQQKIIEAAVRASVVINSLDTAGVIFDDPYGSHFNLKLPLSDMAAGTGGKLIQNSNDLETGLRTLSAPPSVSYVLGFSPENLKPDGSLHNLKVRLTQPAHLTVHARPAYSAPSSVLTPPEKRFHKLQQSVLATDSPAEIPVDFTVTPTTLPTGESNLKVLVHVDARKLPFQEMGDRKVERLIFITALFDHQNHFLTGVEGLMDLRLKTATLTQVRDQGVNATLTLQAPPGNYRVRQIVQEAAAGHISAQNRTIQIH